MNSKNVFTSLKVTQLQTVFIKELIPVLIDSQRIKTTGVAEQNGFLIEELATFTYPMLKNIRGNGNYHSSFA